MKGRYYAGRRILDRFDKLPGAFSHSADCDKQFSKFSDVPGGEPHKRCACWCHTVNFDNDAPPEYVEL